MLIFFFLFQITQHKLTLPFTTGITNEIDFLYESKMENQMKAYIKIGSPEISIPLIIKLRQYPLQITSINSNIRKKIPLFDEEKSSSYKKLSSTPIKLIYDNDYKEGFISVDSFSYGTYGKEESKINKIEFFLIKNLTKNISGILGLNILDDKINCCGFLKQLFNQKKIEESIFYFNLSNNNNSDYKGELIIGEYPHSIDSKNYPEKNYKTIISSSSKNFEIFFENFTFGDYVYFEKETIAELKIESDLFFGSFHFGNFLNNKYFNHYKDCEKIIVLKNYFSFVCLSENAKNNFKDINFKLKDHKFSFYLTKEDVFKEYNGKYYLLIYFNELNTYNWSFGKNFFIKYMLVFNPEKKEIGFYSNNDAFSFLWIFIILLFVSIGYLILLLMLNMLKKPKENSSNELKDDYDYIVYKYYNHDNV